MSSFNFFGLTGYLLAGAVLMVSFVVSYLAWRRNSLTGPAALLAGIFAVGFYLSGGLRMVFLLLLFFLSSTLLTHYRKHDKHRIEKDLHEKKGARDSFQVIANGGPALVLSSLAAFVQSSQSLLRDGLLIAAAGALAASNADTWASELGVLSRKQPVYILSRQPVKAGLSGGVTSTGTLAALAGGTFIAIAFAILKISEWLFASARPSFSATVSVLAIEVVLIALAGFLGSVIDSVLGETLQALYIHHTHQHLTEKPQDEGKSNILKRGWPWLTNDWVNLLSSLLAALILLAVLMLVIF